MWRLGKGLAHSQCLIDAAAVNINHVPRNQGRNMGWTRTICMTAFSPRFLILGHKDEEIHFKHGPSRIFAS